MSGLEKRMNNKMRKEWAAVACKGLVLSLGLVLAACGGGGGDKTKTGSNSHLVTTSVTDGATLTLRDTVVQDGRTTSATLAMDPHYELISIKGCGGKLTGNIYYTGVILTNCTIAAALTPKSYSLTVTSAVGGTGRVTNSPVVYNEVGRVTLEADTGYHVKSATSTCGGSLAANIFTTDKMANDCVVQPVFEVDSTSVEAETYIVTVLSAVGGTPSPETQTVAENDHAKVDFIVDDLYTLVSVTSTCGGTLVSNRFTTDKVTANCTLLPNYKASSDVINPSIDPSELANISGTVAEGATPAGNGAAAQPSSVQNKLVLAYCKDRNGFIGNPVTDTNGYYTGQLRKSSLPCALQVISNRNIYYSLVEGDVSTVNISPLTSLVMAYSTGTHPATIYSSMPSLKTWPDLNAAQAAIAAALAVRGYAMPAGDFLPINTAFAQGDAWDVLLGQFAVSLNSSNTLFSSLQTSFAKGDTGSLPAASQ